MVSNNLLDNVEELNINKDVIENDIDTKVIPSPDAPLLKVVRRVTLNGIIGRKVNKIVKLNVRMRCRYTDPLVAFI